MKYLLVAILFVAALIYLKHPSKSTKICPLNAATIATIGDSLANGFGVAQEDSFAFKTATLLGKTPLKLGINGETSSGLLWRIDAELRGVPSLAAVIISIGGNDFLRGGDKNAAKNNLTRIVQIAKKHTPCVVLLGVPSGVLSSFAGSVDGIYKEVAAAQNTLLEASAMPKILTTAALKLDQIHPNAAGHELIAQNLATLIRQNK